MDSYKLKLLYDGHCPFCSREMKFLARLDRAQQLVFEDITAPGFDPASYGLTAAEVSAFIHGVQPDGRIVKGMEVFRQAYREAGYGWLLAPTGWPLLRPLFDFGYRMFARYRLRLGRLFGGCSTEYGCKR